MKLKLSSFSEKKQIVKADLTCEEIGLNEEGLIDPVKVEVKTGKNSGCLTVECNVEVETNFICDRCLENYKSKLEATTGFIITSDQRMNTDSDEVIYISTVEDEVDISKNIRDAILLVYPVKRICSQQCKGLCASCGKNLNKELCECKNDTIDPRWEKLKEIK